MLLKHTCASLLTALVLSLGTAVFDMPVQAQTVDKFQFELPDGPVAGSNVCGPRTAFWSDFAKSEYLIVYFHGLASHEFEPLSLPSPRDCFMSALRRSKLQAAVVSIDLSPVQSFASCDVNTAIDTPVRKALEISGASKILIYGGSMGGYRALTYLGETSEDILTKISGVLAVEPPDNLNELAKESSVTEVRNAVEKVLANAKPEKVSIQTILETPRFRPRILIISAMCDTVVPTAMQNRLVSFFQESGYPTRLLEVPGNHRIPKPFYVCDALLYLTGEQK